MMASAEIQTRYADLRREKPRIRARDAAQTLGISEAELVASQIGEGATLLSKDFKALLSDIPSFGPVMALSRNETAVHEMRGVYPAPTFEGPVGLFHSDRIDLRIFLHCWTSAFALEETTNEGKTRRSLQFFDDAGEALHKVWLEENSDHEAFARYVQKHRSDAAWEAPSGPYTPPADRPDEEVDVDGLRAAWEGLQDTHDFFPMLRKFKVGRLQAMRLVGGALATQIPLGVETKLLHEAAAEALPIMVFVGNRGMVQIFSGSIERVFAQGPWINVLDHGFNLHLRTDRVAQAWKVCKPTVDGVVTSIELFDEAGELVAYFFGARKPGIPESEGWRALVERIVGANHG